MNVFIGFVIAVVIVTIVANFLMNRLERTLSRQPKTVTGNTICLKEDLLKEAYRSYSLATRERDPLLFFQHIQNASAYLEVVRKRTSLVGMGTEILPTSIGDANDFYDLIKRIRERLGSAPS
jgi:hypothetical protein